MPVELDRRTVLGAACAGCAALVAGCGAGGAAADGSASRGASAAPSTSTATTPSSPPAGRALVALAGIAVGEAAAATTPDGKAVLITRTGEATAVGFSARCTHMGCKVAPSGTQLRCPCHRSVFRAADGSVVSGPAPSPLDPYAVRVVDGQVLPG